MTGGRGLGLTATALLLAAAGGRLPAAGQEGPDGHVLVVVGVGGEAAYRERFHEWAVRLVEQATTVWGLPSTHVVYLGERPDLDPDRIQGRSTRENVERALQALAAGSRPGDRVLVVLFGHGSFDGRDARFNLPGPDPTAEEWATMLEPLAGRTVAFVNTASASGAFLPAVSGLERIVVTATRTGLERNETLFGGFFVDALTGEGADVDRDGRISLREAFDYAQREVERHYQTRNLLRTENAVLQEGEGGVAGGTGRAGAAVLAATFSLHGRVAGVAEATEAADDPQLQRLHQEKRRLEERIAALRARRETLETARYESELEDLLVELALTERAIRERQGRRP